MQTPERFVYGKKSFPDYQPTTVMGDGDGTVNLRSALGCLRWQGKQKQAVYAQAFDKHEHLDMLSSPDVIAYIKKVVTAPSKRQWWRWRNNLFRKMLRRYQH